MLPRVFPKWFNPLPYSLSTTQQTQALAGVLFSVFIFNDSVVSSVFYVFSIIVLFNCVGGLLSAANIFHVGLNHIAEILFEDD